MMVQSLEARNQEFTATLAYTDSTIPAQFGLLDAMPF